MTTRLLARASKDKSSAGYHPLLYVMITAVHTLSNEFNSDPGNVDWNRWIHRIQ